MNFAAIFTLTAIEKPKIGKQLLDTLNYLLLFLNPNKGFFPKRYKYLQKHQTMDTHQDFSADLFFFSVVYEIWSLCHIYATFPSSVFQYLACKNFTAFSLLAHTPCNSSLAVMSKPWPELLTSQPLTVSRCQQFSEPCEDIRLWLAWIFFLFSPPKKQRLVIPSSDIFSDGYHRNWIALPLSFMQTNRRLSYFFLSLFFLQ